MKIFIRLIILMSIVFASCKTTNTVADTNTPVLETVKGLDITIPTPMDASQKLSAQSDNFKKEIIQLTENVYTAVGYDVSNVTMVIGQDSVILVDSGMIPRLVEEMKTDFRKITDKPFAALIFTHGHGDHTGGAPVFAKDGPFDIWGRENHGSESNAAAIAGFQNRHRPIRQAGFMLDPSQRINNGVAMAVYPTPDGGPLKPGKGRKKLTNYDNQSTPNKTYSGDSISMTIAGIKVEIHAAPGETDDQSFVWFPDEKVLCVGDNMYRSWPNLFAIRGTIYRDINDWHQSLSKMLDKDIHYLVPGHTNPWVGQVESRSALTNYRDAVKFVFDKTIEGMNKGMGPDELVEFVQLPESLSGLDYLQEFYGKIDWSVRSIHNGYMGWFDGNATNLIPLSSFEEAKRIANLAGGVDKLLQQAQNAMNTNDFLWAAKLADYLIAIDGSDSNAKLLKAHALTQLAQSTYNALARNYYLTTALQLKMQAKMK